MMADRGTSDIGDGKDGNLSVHSSLPESRSRGARLSTLPQAAEVQFLGVVDRPRRFRLRTASPPPFSSANRVGVDRLRWNFCERSRRC
jgi:hypothetical protein